MKQTVRMEAQDLVACFPDFPLITAPALDSAEQFCKATAPTDLNGLFDADAAMSSVIGGFHAIRDHLVVKRGTER